MLKSGKLLLSSRILGKVSDNGNIMTKSYTAAGTLPLPHNIDPSETTRFSPQRTRDISANVIISHLNHNVNPTTTTTTPAASLIDITADNSVPIKNLGFGRLPEDPHLQSYDCHAPVSLNAVMQSTVPQPFGGTHKFSHLNMPGGQWSQEGKFISQNLQSSHFTALRDATRASWQNNSNNNIVADSSNKASHSINQHAQQKRFYSRNSESPVQVKKAQLNDDADIKNNPTTTTTSTTNTTITISKKEQLKRAFKEYGATVVVFHVTISLASLGGFYALVSSGIDMLAVLEYIGIASSSLTNKIATGASTFVVAYAVHKVFAPVRISITLGATPFIVRYLRAKGILKPPKI